MKRVIGVSIAIGMIAGFLLALVFVGTPSPTGHPSAGGAMATLEGKQGSAFDEAFLDQMIVHHEDAVEMARMALAISQRPELKELARRIIDAQTIEIQQMQEWKDAWF